MLTTTAPVLPRTSPEQQGIASSAILKWVQAVEDQIHDMHSFMLLRHGKVVAEGWWSPYERERRHMLFSLSKSFTSTAVGLAVAEGRFTVDDTVLSFFPDEKPAEMNDHWAAMKVRHLLSMSTGHAVDTWPLMTGPHDWNWAKKFFNVPVVYEPGTHFLYNTGATYMLSAIVQKTTGQKLIDYLQTRLYEPLGIENPAWDESPENMSVGGTGLNIRTEDIARFGQLYLQKGQWQGKQLIPEAWIAEATSKQIHNGDDPKSDWAQGYCYQFWRSQHNNYRGDGAFGQYCIVMPEYDAVLAITSGISNEKLQPPLTLVWDILLPAMNREALPEDATEYEALQAKLASLNLPPVQSSSASSVASQVSGQTYAVDANAFQVETVSLNFSGSGCTLSVKTANGEERIPCGEGAWLPGETRLYNKPWDPEPEPIVTSGAWTADDLFTMVMRLYGTPFVYTLKFHFTGEKLELEVVLNLDFEAQEMEPKHLTAQRV